MIAGACASRGLAQTGPNCDGYGIGSTASTAISGGAQVNYGNADDEGGSFTRDCTLTVTAYRGQHYVQLTFTERFEVMVSDPY